MSEDRSSFDIENEIIARHADLHPRMMDEINAVEYSIGVLRRAKTKMDYHIAGLKLSAHTIALSKMLGEFDGLIREMGDLVDLVRNEQHGI